MAKSRRSYKGAAVSNTLASGGLEAGATSITLGATVSGWPTSAEPFFVVVDPGTSKEEKICVKYSNTTTLTVVNPADTSTWNASAAGRGADNTTDRKHDAGATIYPVFTAREADEANELVSTYTANGDIVVHGSTSFKKISAGTNAHVLQADSTVTDGGVKWGQVATAGITDGAVTLAKLADPAKPGLVHISTTTISNAVTTIISNVFSSTYDSYKIVISNIQRVSAGSGCSCLVKLASGGTADSDLYYFQSTMAAGFAAAGTVSWSGTSNGLCWVVADADGSNKASCEIELINPYLTSATHGRFNAINTAGSSFGNTWFGPLGNSKSTSYDGFALIGAVAINATVSVYGYRS